ncbi:Holliday junction resolvase RuvX [Wenyingzhuangia sp. IMCC45533]
MSKILAIDYGTKKTGLAITDDSTTFAFGLDTIETKQLIPYLQTIVKKESISTFVIGEPKQMNGLASESEIYIQEFIQKCKATFGHITLTRVDERFTSKLAFDAMISGGLKKKQRQNKQLVDKISATIILQTYLDNIKA